jgi:hypothetical protein
MNGLIESRNLYSVSGRKERVSILKTNMSAFFSIVLAIVIMLTVGTSAAFASSGTVISMDSAKQK